MRRRLVLVAAATTSLVTIAFLVPLGFLVREIARDRALDRAERTAQSLGPVLALTDDEEALATAVAATGREEGRLAVFLPDGRVVGGEPASLTAADLEQIELARRGRAFNAGAPGGVHVLVPVALPEQTSAVVRVFVPSSVLDEGVLTSWTVLGLLGVVLVLLAVAVSDRLARTVTRPLADLSGAARRLGAGALDVRVEPGGPDEIVELGSTFNRMVERVRALVASERETVADLSHRLRTPLTALRLDAEAVSDPERAERLAAGVDALGRAVTGIIEEARRPVRLAAGATVDAGVVAQERAEFWGALADDQGRPWAVHIVPGSHRVALARTDLESALDVLLDNVFSHTPGGVGFRVVVENEGRACLVVVDDDGPGVSDPRLLERGVSGRESTGLGIDVARRAAEAAGGRLRIGESPTGGNRFALELPVI